MKHLLSFLFTITTLITNAQDSDQIIINQEDLSLLIIKAIENSSSLDIFQIQSDNIFIEKKMINNEYLGLFFVSGNLNEYSIKSLSGDNSIPNFYPRYNVGVNVRLDHFSNVKNRKRLIEQNNKVNLLEAEETQRQLEEEVTKKYISYLKQKKILNIRANLAQFSMTDFKAIENKFANGDAELEEYNASRRNYYQNQMQLLEAESQYLQAKTELESIVQEKLELLGID